MIKAFPDDDEDEHDDDDIDDQNVDAAHQTDPPLSLETTNIVSSLNRRNCILRKYSVVNTEKIQRDEIYTYANKLKSFEAELQNVTDLADISVCIVIAPWVFISLSRE